MAGSVIVAGARTPIGRFQGGLAGFKATELGGLAIKAALERAGVAGDLVDFVYMGMVLQAGTGQIAARQAAAAGGIPMDVPATTVNKVCLSGLNTIILADQLIAAGEADIVVAGGMESMTNAPYLLPNARAGYRIGDGAIVDALMFDGLTCAFGHCAMGASTELDANGEAIPRAAMDEIAARSHERAASAQKDGRFDAEITVVSVPQRKGDPLLVEADEGVRPGTTVDTLAALRGAFGGAGDVTAGNASQISDGASAVVVMSKRKAAELGVQPLGEVLGYGQVAGPGTGLLHQPSRAIQKALGRAGLAIADIDLVEINEAFAAVSYASARDLGVGDDMVNVNGGAIAMGHPIGASGNRLALTLLHELARRGGGVGAVGICGGGGQGDALIVRSLV